MNKDTFQKIINDNKDKFVCLSLVDSTIRTDYPHTALVIVWNTGIGIRTTIKTMRGRIRDLKCQEQLSKYKGWLK